MCSASFALHMNSLPPFNQSLLKHDRSILSLRGTWGNFQNPLLSDYVLICRYLFSAKYFWQSKWAVFERILKEIGQLHRHIHRFSWLRSPCLSPSLPPSYLSSLQSTGSAVQCWTIAVKSCHSRPPGRWASLCLPRTPSHLRSLAARGRRLGNGREGGEKSSDRVIGRQQRQVRETLH